MDNFLSMTVGDLQDGDLMEEDCLEMADAQSVALKQMNQNERNCVFLAELFKAQVVDESIKEAS